MNQILYEDVETNNKIDIKKIIFFFAVVLIVFGVILAGIGIWNIVTSNKPKENIVVNNGTKPVVATSVFEEDQVLVKVTHDKAIDKILYSWNDEPENEIRGYERKDIEELITMPVGENVLSLRVIDVAGVEVLYTQTYVLSQGGVDITKPLIDLAISEAEGAIIVTVTDETEMSYVTYRWNNEEETRIDRKEDDPTKIEVTIPILRGENDLTIIAVDANNNTETKIQKFNGVTKPKIKVTQYANELTIIVTDEQGLDRVEYTLNGKNYRWTSTTEDRKEWTHKQLIQEGESTFIINAWNKQEAQETFKGKCNYTP